MRAGHTVEAKIPDARRLIAPNGSPARSRSVTTAGRVLSRAIEAYSLRQTKDSNVLLCAVNVEKQESRSYRIERIEGATILNRGFTPRFAIELTPSGPLVAPETPRSGESGGRQPPARRQRIANVWPKTTYVYRCPTCGKRFERSSMDPTLRAHESPSGYACGGRHGIYEGTKR